MFTSDQISKHLFEKPSHFIKKSALPPLHPASISIWPRWFSHSSITQKNISLFQFFSFIPPLLFSLSLMGTGHQTYEKKGFRVFLFLFFLLPCNRMILAQDDGSWWMGEGHFSPSSVLLNMRMALEILRAGPSLMLMIFTMSVWVSSRKASPSIIWPHRHKNGDEHHV